MSPMLASVETADLVLLGVILGVVQVLIALGDRLWGRKTKAEGSAEVESHREMRTALTRLADAQADLLVAVRLEQQASSLRHGELLRVLDREKS